MYSRAANITISRGGKDVILSGAFFILSPAPCHKSGKLADNERFMILTLNILFDFKDTARRP